MEKGIIINEEFSTPEDQSGSGFEKLYFELRKKEQRIYSDEELALLPQIYKNHIHHDEWQLRQDASERLVSYLKNKKKPLKILEVGCGNGWLSSQLANMENVTVTGIDINHRELSQAISVFANKSNLNFEYDDIRDGKLKDRKFDIIIFAASLQYFPSIFQILNTASSYMEENGEIHILDTPFYKDGEVDTARQRSKEYYDLSGFPEMGAFYFHHKFSGLHHFKFDILYDPDSFINKFIKRRNPFYWLCVYPKS